jgi:hypothetical protein
MFLFSEEGTEGGSTNDGFFHPLVDHLGTWHFGKTAMVFADGHAKTAHAADRFPEFGDVYNLCRRQAIQKGLIEQPYSPHSQVDQKITSNEIETIGAALGLATKPN